MEGEGQYVGDEAAEWFSNYMGKPGFKVYQLSRPRVIREHDEWSDIGEAGDKVIINTNNKQFKTYSGTQPKECSNSMRAHASPTRVRR